MRFSTKIVSLLVFMLIIPGISWAIVFGGSNFGIGGYPSHGCIKPVRPVKPYQFIDSLHVQVYNQQVEQFNLELKRYYSCIDLYLENAENDISRIQEKMKETLGELKSGV